MRAQPIPIRPRRSVAASLPSPDGGREELAQQLASRLVGQGHAIAEIIPYVQMYRAGLGPEGRPAGVFLLLGPTGTGKTRTVEALADALHGSEKSLVRVDCGEFQMEHEIAKLIGAPPGYLGHRETPPLLTQQKLGAVTSEGSRLALVLFDEIEKAAPSMTRLLLGVLDKAVLRLGDNTSVNFEHTLIFLTSNLGASAMRKEVLPDFGFGSSLPGPMEGTLRKLSSIGLGAVKRKFAPEFVNRIDAVITYQPLDAEALEAILDQQIAALERHIARRLEDRTFTLELDPGARSFLLEKGTSREYGARELKRIILRKLMQPLAEMLEANLIPPDSVVQAVHQEAAEQLTLSVAN